MRACDFLNGRNGFGGKCIFCGILRGWGEGSKGILQRAEFSNLFAALLTSQEHKLDKPLEYGEHSFEIKTSNLMRLQGRRAAHSTECSYHVLSQFDFVA